MNLISEPGPPNDVMGMPYIGNDMTEPKISIDRDSKTYAIFDEWDCVVPFRPYKCETDAIECAKTWIKARTDKEPEILYPRITSIRVTTRRQK